MGGLHGNLGRGQVTPDQDVQVFDLPEAGGHGMARGVGHDHITPAAARKFKGKTDSW